MSNLPFYLDRLIVVVAFLLGAWSASAESNIDQAFIEKISKRGGAWTAEISTGGRHIALGIRVRDEEGKPRQGLHILRTKDMQLVNTVGFSDGADIDDITWLSDDRFLLNIRRPSKTDERGQRLYRYLVMNADGSKRIEGAGNYVGRISDKEIVTSIFDPEVRKSRFFVDRFDRKTARVSTRARQNCTGVVAYLDKCGSEELDEVPFGFEGLFTRNQKSMELLDELKLVVGLSDQSRLRLAKKQADGKWVDVETPFRKELSLYGAMPYSFLKDGRVLVSGALPGDSLKSLYAWDLDSQETELVFQSVTSEPTRFIGHQGELVAVVTETNYPELHIIDSEHPMAGIILSIQKAFPQYALASVSASKDLKRVVFNVYSGAEPGLVYLLDRTTGKVRLIFEAADHIDRDDLAPQEAVQIVARDGQVINGYISFPATGEKNNPLVVIPHGGPRARDYWGYDPEVQVLNRHGYMVMKVNFRGSDGFGLDFMHQGDGEWGRKTQYDIIDAVNWAVDQGYADADRLAIVGASFGGYSALQSSILEPDMFKAAVGYVGVYDLPLLYEEGDVSGNAGNYRYQRGGKYYLDETLGSDRAKQSQQSPVNFAAQLKAPVLFVHGEDDERAPIEHTERMMAAMDKAGKPYETLFRDKEGHGFYSEENRLDYYTTLVRFLNRHVL